MKNFPQGGSIDNIKIYVGNDPGKEIRKL